MAPRTIADALTHADAGVTALDDKVDVENDAIFVWLRGKSSCAMTAPSGDGDRVGPTRAMAVDLTDVEQARLFLPRARQDERRRVAQLVQIAVADTRQERVELRRSGGVCVLARADGRSGGRRPKLEKAQRDDMAQNMGVR